MKLTIPTHHWITRLGDLIQRMIGLTFDLGGLTIDETEIQGDLGFGRE